MNLQTNPHAHLRAAFDAGCLIQAWHLMHEKFTREHAVALAHNVALEVGAHHSYVSEGFEPHEWVVEAVMRAARSFTSNDGRWDTLKPKDGEAPQFQCEPHLYRVHPIDTAMALAAWNLQYPTMHLPEPVRFYIERLVSNTDPAHLVRENELLRDEVKRLAALVAELEGNRDA